jgi:hypothetical protein
MTLYPNKESDEEDSCKENACEKDETSPASTITANQIKRERKREIRYPQPKQVSRRRRCYYFPYCLADVNYCGGFNETSCYYYSYSGTLRHLLPLQSDGELLDQFYRMKEEARTDLERAQKMKRYISDKIENAECTAASALIDLSKSYGA